MKIPESLRLWWHDGAGVRVLHYSGRQWTVLAVVSFICTLTSLIPVESFLGRSVLVVVPYLLMPAGLAAMAFAIASEVLTLRFRRAREVKMSGTEEWPIIIGDVRGEWARLVDGSRHCGGQSWASASLVLPPS